MVLVFLSLWLTPLCPTFAPRFRRWLRIFNILNFSPGMNVVLLGLADEGRGACFHIHRLRGSSPLPPPFNQVLCL